MRTFCWLGRTLDRRLVWEDVGGEARVLHSGSRTWGGIRHVAPAIPELGHPPGEPSNRDGDGAVACVLTRGYTRLVFMRTRKRFSVGCVLALLTIWGGGCVDGAAPTREWTPEDHAHPPGSVAPAVIPAATSASGEDAAARSLYLVSCAACHGQRGRGDGPQAAPMMRLPDFTSGSWQTSRTDDELVAIIALGRGAMPAFGDRLPESGIRALVRRLRALGPPQAATSDAANSDAGTGSVAADSADSGTNPTQ